MKTNQEFLTSLITRPAFHRELTTQYIGNEFPEGWQPWGEVMHSAIAAAAYVDNQQTRSDLGTSGTPWQSMGAWRLTSPAGTPAVMRLWLEQGGELVEFTVVGRDGRYTVTVGEEAHNVVLSHSQQHWQVELDGTRRSLDILINETQVSLSSPRLNRSYEFLSLEESQLGEAAALKDSSTVIRAGMPGLVTDVLVKEGDTVTEGDIAVVMEAMKLIQNLACPCSGTVKQVLCAGGDNVGDGSLLIEIEPNEE